MSAEELEAAQPQAPEVPAWQAAFRLRTDLTQQDIYAYEIELNKLSTTPARGGVVVSNHALKAAIKAGWLAEPASAVIPWPDGTFRYLFAGENVDTLLPGKLIWYGQQVTATYLRAFVVPPN